MTTTNGAKWPYRKKTLGGMDPTEVSRAFCDSPEYARLGLGGAEPVWANEMIESLATLEWSWAILDARLLQILLFDGMPWAIDEPPSDPAATAREIDALLAFACRVYDAPHAAECRRYLQSKRAVREIGEWLTPMWPAVERP